jgi:hypothetical protein
MIDLVKQMINGTWQDAPSDDVMLFDEDIPDAARGSPGQRPASPSTLSPRIFPGGATASCTDVDSAQVLHDQRRKRMCIVCRFECRPDTLITVVCLEHKVSLCKRVHVDALNAFGCQRTDWTCWEKFHNYYLPRGVFAQTGCVVRSCADYKEKKQWQEEEALRQGAAQTQGIRAQLTAQRLLAFPDAVSPAPFTPHSTPSNPMTPASAASATPSHDYF